MIRTIVTLFVTLLALFVFFVVISFYSIYSSVSATCNGVYEDFEGNCVDAMILVLNSDQYTFEEKNHAIWVLGQLADERALPVLEELYTEVPTAREPLDTAISQYELSKAIDWCKNGNATSFMYKKFK